MGGGVQQRNAYIRCFCWQKEPGIAFWCDAGTEAYEPRLTVVWVRREAGNRFFSYKVLLIKLGISLMQFLNLLCGKDLAIIDFNSWILRDPVAEGGLGEYETIGKEQTKTATELSYAEVISYNKKNLERELQNESRQHNRQQSKTKRREEEIQWKSDRNMSVIVVFC